MSQLASLSLNQLRTLSIVPYEAYKRYPDGNSIAVVDTLQCFVHRIREYENVSRLIYQIHSFYRSNYLTTPRQHVIARPCSLDMQATYSARIIHEGLRNVAKSYVYKPYLLSEVQVQASERMVEFLECKSNYIFFNGDISGAGCYYLLIGLASVCGGVFEPFVYETCFKILLKKLQEEEFGTSWNNAKSLELPKLSSFLVGRLDLQEQYFESLSTMMSHGTLPTNGPDTCLYFYLHLNSFNRRLL